MEHLCRTDPVSVSYVVAQQSSLFDQAQSGDMYQPSKSGGLNKGGFHTSYPQPPHPRYDAHKPSDTEAKVAMDIGAFGAHMASQIRESGDS